MKTTTMNAIRALVVVAMTGAAVMAGIFFAFSTSVMGSLEQMPRGQGAHAMNIINVQIQNPLFLGLFTGTGVACLVLAVLAFARETTGRWWQLVGAILYVGGCVVVTVTVNVPLNDELATADLATAAGVAQWEDFLLAWNPANDLRTIAGTLAAIAFGISLASGHGRAAADGRREKLSNVRRDT